MAAADSTTSSAYVYFISAGASPIKIGVSHDPLARLNDLQTAHYQRLHLLYTIECRDREQAFELESAFHRWYGEVNVRNEWFDVSPKKITEDIHLLTTLAQTVVHAVQHVSLKQIEQMEVHVEKKRAIRRVNLGVGKELVKRWLDENQHAADWSSKQIADGAGVRSPQTANEARKDWKLERDRGERPWQQVSTEEQ